MQISGVEFDIDNIGEMYHAKKDYPVDLIGVQGLGLHHFGQNNMSLNIPRFGYSLDGKTKVQVAVLSKKLTINGNIEPIMKLGSFLS